MSVPKKVANTRDSIISTLYNSKDVTDLISKIRPEYLQDDLKQYVFMVLCEKPDSWIIDAWNKGYLKFFLVRTITNSIFSNNSGFLSIHKFTEIQTDNLADIPDDTDDFNEWVLKVGNEVDKLYHYNAELLKLYAEEGTYRKVSEATGIPIKSVHRAVKKAKEQVKKVLCK